MAEILISFIFDSVNIICGAYCIAKAIRAFEKRRYFLLGVFGMIALYECLMLIKSVFWIWR